ncbi:Hsp20/alpha crystallin family protein [Natronolimnohabitans sp. A-GB9]|uniref:Hsp20/alpha crystallin family protein n=1 Tax=Natronolimnohabitans sp. A-GB9 TaxID=3069757 RepID=UPI0027B4109F|nr:Hsp20/alpha crystallin family protein [Natronolimnohabitans sp. A-GB9]MDQ2049612.1 Hsp20/alpha crystallin family protein [Natronolimnohabitans sp. A-GB9]
MSTDDPEPSDDGETTDRDPSEGRPSGRVGPDTGPRTGAADDRGDDGGHWLSSLLSALESLEGGDSLSGRRRSDRTVLDYDISIRSGEDLGDGSRFERGPAGGDDGRDRRRRDRDRSRSRRRRSPPSSDHHLTVRRDETELLVTADVAGTDPDDVTVGFDDSTLVVAVSGSELDRIDVPWRDRNADASIKNGVLTVRIEPASAGDGETANANSMSETEDDDE